MKDKEKAIDYVLKELDWYGKYSYESLPITDKIYVDNRVSELLESGISLEDKDDLLNEAIEIINKIYKVSQSGWQRDIAKEFLEKINKESK